jgi:hypothetical protein
MSWLTHAPRGMVERKPRHGSPCNGCGVCCVASRCQVGRSLFGEGGRCPALVQTGEHTYGCGVVLEMEDQPELRDAALLLIRAGEGCDARINGEPVDREFHRQQDRADVKNRKAIRKARKLWGIK